jgi:hypothetical protein
VNAYFGCGFSLDLSVNCPRHFCQHLDLAQILLNLFQISSLIAKDEPVMVHLPFSACPIGFSQAGCMEVCWG